MGTSLWLVPPPPATTVLQDAIVSISKAHSSPAFPPHVTLASLPDCISLPEIVSCLSSEGQVEVAFERVRTGQTFFQSVFIAIQTSPQLFQLRQHVHKTLGVQPKTPEFPHLSLYYGDKDKELIVGKLQKDGIVKDLGRNSITVSDIGGFLVDEVWAVKCVGRPEEWSVIEKVSLGVQQREW